ncbi:tRNA (adenine(58)-N(1))-methyltransferase non-catalytic subunit trm6 [Pleurotus pulmonarius]|nr:tRNA (adenine(58)-N(1))-methyltransferase non-catalytic subunit trm6 [Pleurotus pulmonarius]KAF4606384.1 tRNA (adenine(58)-N(1))-methyltransferase non-catalytic subunit trm6 [Pleurotus pulmonarius]
MAEEAPTQNKIRSGDTVLLRIPNGDTRSIKVEKDLIVSIGRLGSFSSNELIDQHYGLTFEIVGKNLVVLPPQNIQELEETDATNEHIVGDGSVKPVTPEEMAAMKEAGVHVSDIIKKQIDQHTNFELKTEYSKDKYKKKKEAKYAKVFTTIPPTLFNVCEYWYNKDQGRIRDLRIDALSQMLSLANIRPGGRYLVVDDASGLVVSGVLHRMGGQGRVLTICDVETPPAYPVMSQMNFSSEVKSIMASLNWATCQEDYTPIISTWDVEEGQIRSDKQRIRVNKRRAASDLLQSTREDLFAGEFEALIVASEYDPQSILKRLNKYLGGSCNIVIHSPYVQILSDLQVVMRASAEYLSPALSEVWLRRYQILPGRTHPMMNMSGAGGFILHATKVYDDPSAVPVEAHRRLAKLAAEAQKNSDVVSSQQDGGDVAMTDVA